MKTKSAPIGAVKAGPEDGLEEGEFIVYPSTFTRKADAYGDVVAKGAFAETIEEWSKSGLTLPGLYGHRLDDPDFFVAGAIEMGEDDHGWWVKGKFDLDSPKGPQVYRLAKEGKLSQLSFAFDVLDSGKAEDDNGDPVNELRKLKVYEFSFVPVGANQDTSVVAIKAIADGLKAGRQISAKNEAALRAAYDQLAGAAGEIKSILSAIDGGSGEDQEKTTHPEVNVDAGAEEPSGANAPVPTEEPKTGPSAATLAAKRFDIYAAAFAAGKES